MSDTARPGSDVMHRVWISAILFGALAAILGVAMLVWPGPSIVVAAALFGAYLVISGVAMVVLAFALPAASGASRFLYFISGAVSVILGILAFRHFGEGYAILLLAIWIAVGFIFRGVSAVALAISYPRFPGRGWSIFFGIISMVPSLGVVVDERDRDSSEGKGSFMGTINLSKVEDGALRSMRRMRSCCCIA